MSELIREQVVRIQHILNESHEKLLQEIKQELIDSGNQNYLELAGLVSDPGDDSVADLLVTVNAAMMNRHILELREIEAAQTRITDGAYGECVDCGLTIRYERLLAYPTAQRCLICQEKHEKTYAGAPAPTI